MATPQARAPPLLRAPPRACPAAQLATRRRLVRLPVAASAGVGGGGGPELRTCKNCKKHYDPAANHPSACRHHTAHFGGEELVGEMEGSWSSFFQIHLIARAIHMCSWGLLWEKRIRDLARDFSRIGCITFSPNIILRGKIVLRIFYSPMFLWKIQTSEGLLAYDLDRNSDWVVYFELVNIVCLC